MPTGAVRKKFLILKEDETMPVNLKQLDEILKKSSLKNEDKIRAIMKDAGLAGDDASAIEACLRVLSSMGDKVSGATMAELNSLIGMGAPSATPDEPVALAAKPGDAPCPPDAKPADAKPVEDVKKEDMPVMKADGTLNEAAIPAPLRPVIVALWSANQAKDAQLTAVKKELDAERDAKVSREYLEKAGELKFLPIAKEDLGATLKEIAIASPKAYEKIEAVLKSANEAMSKGPAFTEVGSNRQGEGGASVDASYDKIKAAAVAHPIAKDKGMTPDAATAYFISKTAEGRRMYSDYVKAKGN